MDKNEMLEICKKIHKMVSILEEEITNEQKYCKIPDTIEKDEFLKSLGEEVPTMPKIEDVEKYFKSTFGYLNDSLLKSSKFLYENNTLLDDDILKANTAYLISAVKMIIFFKNKSFENSQFGVTIDGNNDLMIKYSFDIDETWLINSLNKYKEQSNIKDRMTINLITARKV